MLILSKSTDGQLQKRGTQICQIYFAFVTKVISTTRKKIASSRTIPISGKSRKLCFTSGCLCATGSWLTSQEQKQLETSPHFTCTILTKVIKRHAGPAQWIRGRAKPRTEHKSLLLFFMPGTKGNMLCFTVKRANERESEKKTWESGGLAWKLLFTHMCSIDAAVIPFCWCGTYGCVMFRDQLQE